MKLSSDIEKELPMKHNFKDGDIVTDTEYKEIFVYSEKIDGYRARTASAFRPATDEEKNKLKNSGKDSISL